MDNLKPDAKLLKTVAAQNKKLAETSKYRKEVPTFNDRSATSSDTLIEDLQNGQK